MGKKGIKTLFIGLSTLFLGLGNIPIKIVTFIIVLIFYHFIKKDKCFLKYAYND